MLFISCTLNIRLSRNPRLHWSILYYKYIVNFFRIPRFPLRHRTCLNHEGRFLFGWYFLLLFYFLFRVLSFELGNYLLDFSESEQVKIMIICFHPFVYFKVLEKELSECLEHLLISLVLLHYVVFNVLPLISQLLMQFINSWILLFFTLLDVMLN